MRLGLGGQGAGLEKGGLQRGWGLSRVQRGPRAHSTQRFRESRGLAEDWGRGGQGLPERRGPWEGPGLEQRGSWRRRIDQIELVRGKGGFRRLWVQSGPQRRTGTWRELGKETWGPGA